MEKELVINALCNGMFGIGSGKMLVTYNDEEPVEKFFKDCHRAMHRNYTSILHWKGIDGFEPAKCIFVPEIQKEERLVRMVMQAMVKRHTFIEYRDTLMWSMKHDEEKYIDGKRVTFKYEDVWRVSGGWTLENIDRVIRANEEIVQGVYRTLEALGVDVNDEETEKRILTNLGFYRVERNTI